MLIRGFVGKAEYRISSTSTDKLHIFSLLAHFKQEGFLLFLIEYQSKSICEVRCLD